MSGLLAGREFVAELLGTCVLIMFGCGSVAQSVGATKYWLQTSEKKELNYVYKWWSIELSFVLQGAEPEGQWRHAFYQSRLVLRSSSEQNFGWF